MKAPVPYRVSIVFPLGGCLYAGIKWSSLSINLFPTAALFVDGRCLHKGQLTDEQIKRIARE